MLLAVILRFEHILKSVTTVTSSSAFTSLVLEIGSLTSLFN